MSRFLAFFAFAIFAIFVGILGWKVPNPDLLLVIALTLVLVAYDFLTSAGNNRD